MQRTLPRRTTATSVGLAWMSAELLGWACPKFLTRLAGFNCLSNLRLRLFLCQSRVFYQGMTSWRAVQRAKKVRFVLSRNHVLAGSNLRPREQSLALDGGVSPHGFGHRWPRYWPPKSLLKSPSPKLKISEFGRLAFLSIACC